MPEFTVEAWASFKQQFLSVIQFIMYCFDLCFDNFRSNPLLYIAFFFPVFALAFLFMFDLFFNLVPFIPLLPKSKNLSVLGDISRRNINTSSYHSKNLATQLNPVKAGASGGSMNAVSYGSSGGSMNAVDNGISGGSVNGKNINGTNFRKKKENAVKLFDKLKDFHNNEDSIYQSFNNVDNSDTVAIGPVNYNSDTKLKQWLPGPDNVDFNKNSNIDIDVD